MFTGIVTAVGRIARVERGSTAARIVVDTTALALDDVRLGDSIAVSGVCLTVVAIGTHDLAFDVSHETLRCTVGLHEPGAAVNLEKAMRLADRVGGHLVTGHVDGVGSVAALVPLAQGHVGVRIGAPPELAKLIARKGSIAVNGVSLTINAVSNGEFDVNLIPHTLAQTNLQALRPGDRVNLEADMIARYVERMLEAMAAGGARAGPGG